jgi:hypothetical protein
LASDDTFNKVDVNTCILHIPAGSRALYERASGWRDFLNVLEDASSGIGEVSASKISVYPNPVKHDLFIRSDYPVERMEIYNQSGVRLLIDESFTGKTDVSHLPDGIYYVRIYVEDIPEIRKIVIRK